MRRKNKAITEQLDSYLKELCLSQTKKNYKEIAAEARKESLSYEEYLLTLTEEECTHRRNNRIDRQLRQSKIPLYKNVDTFDLKRLPAKVTHQVKILFGGTFIDHTENVLIFGNPGSGKTHLLCAIGQEIIRTGRKAYYTTCSMLVQTLLQAKRDLELPKMINKLSRFDALIIDDIGYVQQNREEMEVLFTLLAERYERGSILLSSNLPFSKWEKIFKDPMVTAAAIDRLVHHSVILELNIPSYRMNVAKNKKQKKGEKKRQDNLSTESRLSTKKEKSSKKERKATATTIFLTKKREL